MLALLLAAVSGMPSESLPRRCDRGAPEPLGFHARGFGYVAEVFPPKSRHNHGSRPIAYFYEVGYPGTEWRVVARRLWTAELANSQMPQAALVSMAGDVVTLDDYYQAGGDHALVIYDRAGRLIRSFAIEQLLDPGDLVHVPLSDCGRLWRENAMYYFTRTPAAKLYVTLSWGRVLELTLATGELRRGTLADFATLRDITVRSFPNEQAEIWSLKLRFSSLTDMISGAPRLPETGPRYEFPSRSPRRARAATAAAVPTARVGTTAALRCRQLHTRSGWQNPWRVHRAMRGQTVNLPLRAGSAFT